MMEVLAMDIYNTIIENTDKPEIQEILKKLDPDKDVLLTAQNTEDSSVIDIQYIKPINRVVTVGEMPAELMDEIRQKHSGNFTIEVTDYAVTFENGLYGLTADVQVNELALDTPKAHRLPLPLLILVGIATGLLTLVLIIIKLVKRANKN
jgi:hypothetical protein